MSQQTVTSTTRPATLRGRHDTHQPDRPRERGRSKLWTLIEALAYAGAFVDPSGIMAVERLRRAEEDAARADHR